MAAVTGFTASAAFILAIGPQNTFILRQGLARSHVFALALFCAVSDAILITAGVAGFGYIVELYPIVPEFMRYAGAAFLFAYGFLRFRAVMLNNYDIETGGKPVGLWRALATIAAFTWLNPHVYLDTVVLLGAISTEYPATSEKVSFALGAMLPSFIFFFGLGYGARLLAPFMQSPQAWRIMDIIIGVVMWLLAAKLLS
ncbi:LysE/ArgO family amino acid transporter [Yoonia sp.]|uniref:LysE/ArgO family amino acid transporter n=1 Tax=Yoonia sp. TaxID=2212373 RepID=UPI0035C7B264